MSAAGEKVAASGEITPWFETLQSSSSPRAGLKLKNPVSLPVRHSCATAGVFCERKMYRRTADDSCHLHPRTKVRGFGDGE